MFKAFENSSERSIINTINKSSIFTSIERIVNVLLHCRLITYFLKDFLPGIQSNKV